MLFVQISDPHVLGDRDTEQGRRLYSGTVDTAAVLARVVAAINVLDPRPEVVLLTGDIAALTGEPGDYVTARAVLDGLEIPLLPVPGNHDLRVGMRQAFGQLGLWDDGREHLSTQRRYGGVDFIGLDTLIEGEPGGRFGAEQLDWLDSQLAATEGNPAVLFMHHPPFKAGWPFADPIRALDGDLLEAIVARYPNILAVLCGHLHRPMIHRFGGTVAMAAPASSRQGWADLREGYRHRWTNEPPAFVQHLVHDGALTSFIVPVEDGPA